MSTTTSTTSTTTDATTSTTARLTTEDIGFRPLDTSTWDLPAYVNTTVSLAVNQQRLSFEVARIQPPQSSIQEFLVISCCTVRDKSEERFGGARAISRIEFDYVYTDPVNESAVEYGPTTLLNPAYVNLAPCPCDLSKDVCDFDCFCDNDCTLEDKSIFGRNITGLFGGEAPLPADHVCSQNNRIGAADWAPFLCTQFENSAYLGDFYATQLPIVEHDLLPSQTTNSYRIGEYPLATPFGLSVGYNKGAWIDRDNEGYISIPQATYNGMCTDTVPIRYLNDVDSSCTMTMEERLCTDSMSRLNAANYLQRNDGVFNSAPFQPVIQVASKHGLSNTVPIETSFRCADSYYTDSEAASYCSWDDDQTYPPSPFMESNVCKNAVVGVTYVIEYNNTSIEKITASFIMADIPLEVAESTQYTRSWYESIPINQTVPSNTTNSTSAPTFVSVLRTQLVTHTWPSRTVEFAARYRVQFKQFGLTESVRYSGRPGYNFGSAINVISVNQTNVTTLVSEPHLTLPIAGVDGLCKNSGSNLLEFASNQMSQCQLIIPAESFTDCDTLRLDVLQQLELLFPAISDDIYISKFGTPNYKDGSQWLPLIRDVSAYNSSDENTTATTDPITATNMPLSGVETITEEPQVSLMGKCASVPTSARLVVLYALAGRSAGYPIYLIYGVKVQVTSSDWQFRCQHDVCEEGKFSLTFSTEYIEIPSTRPSLISRYEKKKMDECVSCEPPWTLEAFLYPVAGGKIPAELRAENLAMFLLLVSCITVFWYMTRPWLHKHYLLV
ncbi:tectonic-2-like [Watersipora subatra]|uniref:tectonic-2-like n=1 Tax=Watersipora subatra TaxID=2589382 RepID=UPI00355C5647